MYCISLILYIRSGTPNAALQPNAVDKIFLGSLPLGLPKRLYVFPVFRDVLFLSGPRDSGLTGNVEVKADKILFHKGDFLFTDSNLSGRRGGKRLFAHW